MHSKASWLEPFHWPIDTQGGRPLLRYGPFHFLKVDSEDLRKETYRLRYEIYVKEFGFENPEDHPGGIETDEYEPYSIHFAALKNDEVIGTIRLVLYSEKGFPIEHAVRLKRNGASPPPDRIGEISRLAISHRFRRRSGDGPYGVESYLVESEGGILPESGPPPEVMNKRKNPVIVMGLYQAMYHEAKKKGLLQWYMITEEKIFKSLKKFGFMFRQVGEPVEYHGLRIPYLGDIPEIERRLIKENPLLLRLLLKGLEKKYCPPFGVADNVRFCVGFPYYANKAYRCWKGKR
jgi:N-acyl amino acid synthase of PEP-CTERM/exosortase system